MTFQEALLILGGLIVGFGLGDLYHYYTKCPSHRDNRPNGHVTVADGWDEIQHVRIVNRRTK